MPRNDSRAFVSLIVPGLTTSHLAWEGFQMLGKKRTYFFDYDSRGPARNAASFLRNRTFLTRFMKSKRVIELAEMLHAFLDQMEAANANRNGSMHVRVFCHSHGCVLTLRALERVSQQRGKSLPIRVIALAPPMFIPQTGPKFELQQAINYINDLDWIWSLHGKRERHSLTNVTFSLLKPTFKDKPRNEPFCFQQNKGETVTLVIRSTDKIPPESRTRIKSHSLGSYIDLRGDLSRLPLVGEEKERCFHTKNLERMALAARPSVTPPSIDLPAQLSTAIARRAPMGQFPTRTRPMVQPARVRATPRRTAPRPRTAIRVQ